MFLSILGDTAKQEAEKRKADMQAKKDVNVSATKKTQREIKDDDKVAKIAEDSKGELSKNAESMRKAKKLTEAPINKISRRENVDEAASDGKISMNELNPVAEPKRKAKKQTVAPQAKKARREDIVDVSNDAKIPDDKSNHKMRTRSRAVKPAE